MNISELARRLNFPLEELRQNLPKLGFDIGGRAIKVDDRTAWRIIQSWPRLKREIEKMRVVAGVAEEVVVTGPVEKKAVKLPPVLTVREFATRLSLPMNQVITELMKNGILATLNERLDYSTAAIIAEDLGFVPEKESLATEGVEASETIVDALQAEIAKEEATALQPRPPVIVVMGHVDHGKTKLLDAIRKTNVMAGEAGGITQHIGAYQAEYKGHRLTFIDTPGHAAFTTMRSRGARVADLAILIVAADDGVQPQTVEALKIIRAAKLPFLVAVNKIDKNGADPERVKSQLAQEDVMSEEWGGKIPFVPISAKNVLGIDTLLETLLILAELEKDKIVANPLSEALGAVIESHLDPNEGAVATVLIQNGSLFRNDYLVFSILSAVSPDKKNRNPSGVLLGRVKAMRDWNNKIVEKAPPGMPVRVLGFKVVPDIGDIVRGQKKAEGLEKAKANLFRQAPTALAEESVKRKEQQFLDIILKADVQGSLEALVDSLEKNQTPEVAVKILNKEVGSIGEADVLQAEASGALIYGFNVEPSEAALKLAETKKVAIKTFKIIYELLDDAKNRLEAMLAPEIVKTDLGKASILQIFRTEKSHMIVGARIEDGKAVPGAKVNIMRNGALVGEGKLEEVQSAKQAAKEIRMGSECGLKIATRQPLQVGDILELFKEEKKDRKIDF